MFNVQCASLGSTRCTRSGLGTRSSREILMCIRVMLVPTPPPNPHVFIYMWLENAHSCTLHLPGPKIGGACDDDDQKALFKKRGLPHNPGYCKALLVPIRHGVSWSVALISCTLGSHI